jgi:hypothetical protein
VKTLLDILQAAGIGAAVGIRPFLPALLVGALAAGNLGVDFSGTKYAFLEKAPWLLAMVVCVVALNVLRQRAGDARLEATPAAVAFAVVCVVIAGLEGAGSLADRGHPVAAGIAASVVCALLAIVAVQPLFARVRSRLEPGAANMLVLYREGLALAAAGLSVLFPPLAIVILGALAFLLAGGRRREGEKYAGLRILR